MLGSLQALLFIIIHDQYAKTSEVDELQAPWCYSYFSSQDEFMHIKPRTCCTAIIHEAQQAHSWYWLCWDNPYMLFKGRKSKWKGSKKWKRKKTQVLHNLNLLKRKKERGRHKQFNFTEQYIDFESQWGSWQTAENAIFHYRDLMLFTERWYAYEWRDVNERETSWSKSKR